MPPPGFSVLPDFWRDVAFDDPLCILIGRDGSLTPGGVADTAAMAAGIPWAGIAARVGNGARLDGVVAGAAAAPWRVRCERSGEFAWLRAEPMAASIARAEQFLHFELLRRVADGLQHELRGPLSALALNLQLLERDLAGDEQSAVAGLARALPALRGRLAELGRMQDRTVDDWCRMDGVAGPVDPAALIDEVRQLCRACLAKYSWHLEVAPDDGLPVITACPWRLKRIVLAGILAAAGHPGGGGALQLAVRRTEQRLTFQLDVHPADGALPAAPADRDAPALLAAVGALVWGLAQGRDEWHPGADAGWRMDLLLD